jgi:tetratricopeptide (TPR) repeat protein
MPVAIFLAGFLAVIPYAWTQPALAREDPSASGTGEAAALAPSAAREAEALEKRALTLRRKGDHAGARDLYLRALEERDRISGPDSPEALRVATSLAMTLRKLGDRAGARDVQTRLADAFGRVSGPDHLDTMNALNVLADDLRRLGDHAGARSAASRLLEARERGCGAEHPFTVNAA